MPSISRIVRELIRQKPIVYEGLIEGVISHAALAEHLHPEIERQMEKEVNMPAVVMAIRRYSESLQEKSTAQPKVQFKEITMKTGLVDVTIVKSPSALGKIKQLYSLVNYDKGDTLNIIHGNYEMTIVISERYLDEVRNILEGEKILSVEQDLVSLSISFSSDFLHTPGILAQATRKLFWNNINIYENISTMTELIYIISKKDAMKAYNALQELT